MVLCMLERLIINNNKIGRYGPNGRGMGWGDHFIPHKFIKRSFERWANTSKQLVNAGREHQAPRKGSPFSSKGGRTKDKRQKEKQKLGMETCPGERVVKEKFPNTRQPSHKRICGEFWNLGGQHNREGKKKRNPQITGLDATPSGQVDRMLMSTSSEQGRNRELLAARLGCGLGLNALRTIWGS